MEGFWREARNPRRMAMIYTFEEWVLNSENYELSQNGSIVSVEPLTFSVIEYLIENRHIVVSRDSLLEDVWQGRNVSDWAVSAAIKSARLVLGDTATPRRFIQTIHSKGFRFIAKVLVETGHLPAKPAPNSGPSLVVVPFETIGNHVDESYFSDGLTEDLITDLSLTSGLNVATRNTSFAIKSETIDRNSLNKELGVTHLLEGSVRRQGNKIRVNAHLVEISSGLRLWSDRFTAAGDEIFDLQDELCLAVITSLKLHLTASIERHETQNVKAYDQCLRGRSEYYRYTPDSMARALSCFELATDLDPNYAAAYAYQSYCRTAMYVFAWSDSDENLYPALELAKKAVSLNEKSAVSFARLGWVLSYLGEPEKCVGAFKRAIALTSGSAEVFFAYGESLNRLGQPELALQMLDRAFGVESYVPPSWDFAKGHSYTLQRNYNDALECLETVVKRLPSFLPARVQLARLYVEIDRTPDAHKVSDEISTISPDFTLEHAARMFPYPQSEEHTRLNRALSRLDW